MSIHSDKHKRPTIGVLAGWQAYAGTLHPGIVTIIPQFMMFARLHLTGTYWPWILWGSAASPFHIFLF